MNEENSEAPPVAGAARIPPTPFAISPNNPIDPADFEALA